MTLPIKLIAFDNQNTENHPFKKSHIISILGNIGSGKTTVLMSILNEVSHDTWNRVIIFSANKLDAKLCDNISEDCELYGADKDKLYQIIAEIRQDALDSKKAKKKIPKTLLVLDDLAGDSSFFSSQKTAFNSFILSVRHYNVTLIFTTQKLKLVPPTIRVNTGIWFLSRLPPEEKKQIFRELPFPKDKLEKAYDIATAHDYSWLQINVGKRLLIRNFSDVIDV